MNQTSIYDITDNYHGGNVQSTAANPSSERKQQLLARVVTQIRSMGPVGATSDEIESILQLSHQTVSARVTEAKAMGVIRDSGFRRKTKSGRYAAVMVVA